MMYGKGNHETFENLKVGQRFGIPYLNGPMLSSVYVKIEPQGEHNCRLMNGELAWFHPKQDVRINVMHSWWEVDAANTDTFD